MPKSENPYPDWPGFDAPRYTPVPDDLFDLWLPHLSGAEVKVLLYICRRTFGFKKDADAISLAQITGGIIKRDGSRLDWGAGVAKSSAVLAIQSLEAKGLILVERQQSAERGDEATVYRLRLRPAPVSDFRTRGPRRGSENRTRGGLKITPAPVRESDAQETDVQDTEIQEDDMEARAVESPAPPLPYSPVIAGAILDLARALHDELAGPSAVQEALRLWQQSRLSEAAFVNLLHAAQERNRKLAGVLAGVARRLAEQG